MGEQGRRGLRDGYVVGEGEEDGHVGRHSNAGAKAGACVTVVLAGHRP